MPDGCLDLVWKLATLRRGSRNPIEQYWRLRDEHESDEHESKRPTIKQRQQGVGTAAKAASQCPGSKRSRTNPSVLPGHYWDAATSDVGRGRTISGFSGKKN